MYKQKASHIERLEKTQMIKKLPFKDRDSEPIKLF